MIYSLTLFTSGLIGTLLSVGYVLIFTPALFVRVAPRPARRRCAPSTMPPASDGGGPIPVSSSPPTNP